MFRMGSMATFFVTGKVVISVVVYFLMGKIRLSKPFAEVLGYLLVHPAFLDDGYNTFKLG